MFVASAHQQVGSSLRCSPDRPPARKQLPSAALYGTLVQQCSFLKTVLSNCFAHEAACWTPAWPSVLVSRLPRLLADSLSNCVDQRLAVVANARIVSMATSRLWSYKANTFFRRTRTNVKDTRKYRKSNEWDEDGCFKMVWNPKIAEYKVMRIWKIRTI